MNITYFEQSPKVVRVLFDDRCVGNFRLLSIGWKFMWVGDTWMFLSHRIMADIQVAIKDKQYLLNLTTKLTR